MARLPMARLFMLVEGNCLPMAHGAAFHACDANSSHSFPVYKYVYVELQDTDVLDLKNFIFQILVTNLPTGKPSRSFSKPLPSDCRSDASQLYTSCGYYKRAHRNCRLQVEVNISVWKAWIRLRDIMTKIYSDAEPYKWPPNGDLNTVNTCIIVIDVQVDFCAKGGYMDSMGNAISLTRKPIRPIQNVLRTQGFHVLHTGEKGIDLTFPIFHPASYSDRNKLVQKLGAWGHVDVSL